MRRAAAVILAIAGVISSAAPAAASGTSGAVTADLEGRAIPVAEIPAYYCHDRDFPRIHCFRTANALERARVATPSARIAAGALSLSTTASTSDYAMIYSDVGHTGSYTVLSQNYDALAIIGWNDRIRSYTVLNSASGSFYTDWFAGGYRLGFCCNSYVSSLSPTFDATISSAYRA